MATVISEPATNANSYASVAFTRSIWDNDSNKNNYTFTDVEIGEALITATSRIDNENASRYKGTLYNADFALFFPRSGLEDRRGVAITDMTTYPLDLQKATAEQAYWELVSNREAESDINVIKRQRLEGVGEKEYFSPAQQRQNKKAPLHENTIKLLSAFTDVINKYTSYMMRG